MTTDWATMRKTAAGDVGGSVGADRWVSSLDRSAMRRLATAATELSTASERSETRLLAACDNLRRSGKLSADDWWQARLAVVIGARR